MIIAIIMLIAICIILLIALSNKTKKDNKIVAENIKQQKINEKLKQEQQELLINKEIIKKEILADTQQCQHLNSKINELRINISNTIEQNKEISNKAFQEYQYVLERSYKDIEDDFDARKIELQLDFETTKKDLDKLKATRAAAHEAILKEKEIKKNKDNYRLAPSDSDLADSRRLEIVKKELNKPRILCMLIWQTYWQPLAKKQFPIILQDKTKCGIYKITNLITTECYIWQAVDVYKRWCEHCKCGLGIDTPPGNKLYKAMQEYGLDNFTFELLEECSNSELNEKEKYFIELYQSNIYGYNSTGGNK